MSDLKQRLLYRFYASRCLDIYGMIALDMDLQPMQQVWMRRLGQILRHSDEPIEDMELTLTNIARDLERTFADAGRAARAALEDSHD